MRWLAGRLLRLLPEQLVARLLPAPFGYRLDEVPPPPDPPVTATRLYIAPVNWAGQAYQWARAVERFVPDVSAVTMVYGLPSDFAHPADIVVPVGAYLGSQRWQRRQYEAVSHGFTHVLVEAERQPFGAILDESVVSQIAKLRADGLMVAMLCHGSDIRLPSRHAAKNPDSPFRGGVFSLTKKLEAETKRNRAVLDELGLPVYVSTPDLLLDVPDAKWLPVVVEVEQWRAEIPSFERRRPVVAHAPSKGAIKGSELIDPLLSRLDDEGLLTYRRVQGVPANEMPSIYRDADIVLDQFRLGSYGVAACEAMAAGRLVIGHASGQVRDHVTDATGLALPIVQARAAELESVLRAVICDPRNSRDTAAAGQAFVETVHSGEMSAAVLADFLASGVPRRPDSLE